MVVLKGHRQKCWPQFPSHCRREMPTAFIRRKTIMSLLELPKVVQRCKSWSIKCHTVLPKCRSHSTAGRNKGMTKAEEPCCVNLAVVWVIFCCSKPGTFAKSDEPMNLK